MRSQRPASCSSFAAAWSLVRAPRPRAALLASAASRLASVTERRISRPARSLRRITSAFASPVRRLSVREIWRTARPIERERSRTRGLAARSLAASLRPSRASARAPWSANSASVGYLMSASTTVESIRAARGLKRRSLAAFSISPRVKSATTPGPSLRVNLRTVDSSGTLPDSGIRQKRRRCNESETSRTSVSYPHPLRCLTTIKRTYVSIAIVGRPCATASRSQRAAIGSNSPASRSNSSTPARSSGNSRASTGNSSSQSVSACAARSLSTSTS